MSDERIVAMSAEQRAELDRYILELMRAHQNERAALMMHLARSYMFAPPLKPPPPSNVVELRGGTTGEPSSRRTLQRPAPDAPLDERPPASVHSFDPFSRKVPCS